MRMNLHKPRISLPTFKNAKTVLLVGTAVVLLLAVFLLGAIRHAQTVQAAATQSRLVAAKQKRDKQASDDKITALTASVKAETDKRIAVCGYVSSLAAQKALAKAVAVPAACK